MVTAFDGASHAWASTSTGLDHLPHLDGRLLFDPADLTAFEDDFGHLVHRAPLAVLEPGSVADVAAMIEFCGPRQIPVAARGQGHQTDGQAQVSGGLVIDTGR